ncbi:MAG: hypothetical protein F4X92_03060 [Gammaproteobacteria bacterium]|nr:hypothetical protein [Gammaproteobacteria bacterium]
MNTPLSSVAFDDQNGSAGHSRIEQAQDDYDIRKASSSVLDIIHSESHAWQSHSGTGSFAQFPPSALPREAGQAVGRTGTEKIVPLVNGVFTNKPMAKPGRTLIPITEWEGYVDGISDDKFSVKVVNIRSKSSVPVDEVTFDKDEISEYDRPLLKEGAIVRWIIGRERLDTGQVRNVSELHFRRLPAHSKEDYKRAHEEASALLKGINWDNEAEC